MKRLPLKQEGARYTLRCPTDATCCDKTYYLVVKLIWNCPTQLTLLRQIRCWLLCDNVEFVFALYSRISWMRSLSWPTTDNYSCQTVYLSRHCFCCRFALFYKPCSQCFVSTYIAFLFENDLNLFNLTVICPFFKINNDGGC